MSAVVMIYAGEYDLSHSDDLRAELHAIRDEAELVLDMGAVTYIDSICIGELLDLQAHRSAKGLRQAAIVRRAPIVERLFDILAMESGFRVAQTLDDVLPKDGTAVVVQYANPGNDPIEASPHGHVFGNKRAQRTHAEAATREEFE